MKKRSQSGIITAVLLIIIIIVSVVIVWNVVYTILKNSSAGVGTDMFTTRLEIKQTKLYVTGGAQVQVHRSSGSGTITSLKIIFENKNGERKIVKKVINISELETKNIDLTSNEVGYNNSDIKAVYISPMFGNANGNEISENSDAYTKDSSGNRVLDVNASSGLVSWWKFDGDMKDSVGGNNGVCGSSCPSATTDNRGNVGGALSFDGISNSINTSFIPPNTFSVSLWYNANINQPYNSGLFSTFGSFGATFKGIYYSFLTSPAKETLWYDGNNIYQTSQTLNNWNFLTITSDGSSILLYKNGLLISPQISGTTIHQNVFLIGDSRYNSRFFNGTIDNVMIFNRSLSAEEVLAIYNNQK